MQRTIDSDPAMVKAIATGAAKASVFVMANPDCERRLHWAKYPASKPNNADEATAIRWDLNTLQSQLNAMQGAFDLNGGKLWGNATPEGYGRMQTFMQQAGLVQGGIDPALYMPTIPHFFEDINDFDAAAVRAQAEACRT
jgi:NitT/TauT family transport system substrate-binding protein